MDDINVFKRRYDREKLARIEAESLLESKSRELYLVNEQLKSLTADLESIINERTAELKMAHDHAIASSQAKSLFLANMSHEIRTPMNGVLGVLHLLQKTPLTDRQKQLMETAKSSGELLLAIINDILDVSKIEAGELILEKIDFDLPKLLITTVDNFSHDAAKKSLQIHIDLEPNLPQWIQGDPTRIRQIINNLLSNAIKFTHQGAITLTAKLVSEPPSDELEQSFHVQGHWIEISVTDTGIGISPEQINQIFSPFTQADESITRQFGGTGLGLAICAHLTQSMGKKISVTSQPNVGSRFEFCLFAPDAKHEQIEKFENDFLSLRFINGHVMLVDDNPINREIAREILEEHGLTVSTYDNGQQALDAIQQHPFNVVLMDIQMPVMDGLTASRKIRDLGGPMKNLPILAMTAHAAREDIEKSLAAGMNGHLTKPIQPEKLIEQLAQWIAITKSSKPTNENRLHQKEPSLPFIAGFDVEGAFNRANKNLTLYNKVILGFCTQHAQDIEKMRTALDDDDFLAIEKISHKLKGSSLSIGATQLSDAAHKLETACKTHQTKQATTLIDDLASKYSATAQAIENYRLTITLPNSPEPPPSTPINREDFEQFYRFCNSDFQKAEAALSRLICAIPNHPQKNDIQTAFDQFDMEKVVAHLKDIESSLFELH